MYAIANNAYVCTEHLLTTFPGDENTLICKNAYNYYLLQLQQTVKHTFGTLVQKWLNLKQLLCMRLCNASKVIMGCAILHNFCINEKLQMGAH